MLKLSLLFCLYKLAFAGTGNWETCKIKYSSNGRGVIWEEGSDCEKDGNGNYFHCCEAPGGDDGKLTCRPEWECRNNHLPNWKTCHDDNSCAPDAQGNEFKCCVAKGDGFKKTCRPHWEC